MKNTKILFLSTLLATGISSQPALAGIAESASPAASTIALESTDFNFAFEQTGEPMQMAALSEQEMRETEGAVAPLAYAAWTASQGAVTGAVVGAAGHTFMSWWNNKPVTPAGLGASAAGGAVGGAFSGGVLGAAGQPTSLLSPASYTSQNLPGTLVTRANGAALGQSTAGFYNYNPSVSNNTNWWNTPLVSPSNGSWGRTNAINNVFQPVNPASYPGSYMNYNQPAPISPGYSYFK